MIVAFVSLSLPCPVQAQWSKIYKAYKIAKGAYKAYKAYTITDEEFLEYANDAVKAMDAQNLVCKSNNKYSIRLAKITKGLTSIDGRKLNYKVYYDQKTANAFACPDGSVRVYSKLMDIMTDEEILGVICHEIGHVACQHSLKEYKEALLASATRDGLSAYDGTLGELAEGTLGELAEYMVNAKYSRVQETEADTYGYDFLKSHGKNPWYLSMALQKLQNLHKGSEGGKYVRAVSTMFSSHPDIAKRVQRLGEKAQKDGFKKPSSK